MKTSIVPRIGTLLMLTVILGLGGGCAIQPQPDGEPESTDAPVSRPSEPPQLPEPGQPDNAVSLIVQESREQVNAGNWQLAIAMAERGLRIDRHEPELYLLLAKSYLGLSNRDRAFQFARQGLRYVNSPENPVAVELRELLSSLERQGML